MGFGAVPFLAMELVEGSPLDEHVEEHAYDTDQRIRLFIKVCEAVIHAHSRGIIHCDLKPRNILVSEVGHPKVLDFGISQVVGDAASSLYNPTSSPPAGSRAYMSPEQLTGDPDAIDQQSDVYALGIILHKLLTGQVPPDAKKIAMFRVPGDRTTGHREDLAAVIVHALSKHKDARYASVSDLAEDLRRYLRGDPVSVRSISAIDRFQRACLKNKAVSISIAVTIIGLAASTLLSVQLANKANIAYREAEDAREGLQVALDSAKTGEDLARAVAQLANQRAEVNRRNAYDTNLRYIAELITASSSETMRLLKDPIHCPPEYRDYTWQLLRSRADRHLREWHAGENVASLDVSADGQLLVAATKGPGVGQVRFCDIASGKT